MVQEMTQFSPQSIYDPTCIFPHFRPDSSFSSWNSHQESPSYNELVRATGNLPRNFDASPPQEPLRDAPVPSSATPKRKPRKGGKGSYKHVPHREKPPHLVARRNARERRRVQAVNTAFSRLRKCVPTEAQNKRLSKVKTLHRAIEYIQMLQEMLTSDEDPLGPRELALMHADHDSLNKENQANQRWMPLTAGWDEDNQSSCLSFYDDFTEPMHS